jgi:hypothetical protein
MSRTPKRASGLAFASCLLALAACTKRRPPKPTSGDAAVPGTGAAVTAVATVAAMATEAGTRAPAYAGPFEPHVVARVLSPQTSLVPLADGTVVLQAGLFRYALAADGRASLIGNLPSYAAKMPPDDIHLAGYDVKPVVAGEAVPGARPWHDLRGPQGRSNDARAVVALGRSSLRRRPGT